jgi:intein/homing endonuclease
MGFLNSVSGFFKRDKNTQIAKQAKGISVADPNVRFGNGIVTGSDGNSMGMMGLSAALNMDQDLMMRYSDYEGMDEYPELQNGLDIFADDCTVTDNIRGKTIWAESKDKVIRDIVDDLLHRRLRIEEDIWSTVRSLGKYGNCLPTGTRVWTEQGIVPIEDIKIGMRVLGYKDGRRELFSVIDTFDNGEKEIFKISTKHRELYATADHPILVNRNGKMEWVRVRDLRLERWPNGNINQSKTDKIVMATKAYDNNTIPPWDELFVKNVKPKERSIGGNVINDFHVPELIEPWICRLLGFLWGDGYVASEKMSISNSTFGYSRGVYDDRNDYYDGLLRKLSLKPKFNRDKTATLVHSILFKCFMLSLGWCNGASKKRLPAWLSKLPWEHRKAFVDGFMDADGWIMDLPTWKLKCFNFEIANIELARDLKNIIDGLGYRSGRLGRRHRKVDSIAGRKVYNTHETAKLTFSMYRYEDDFACENVLDISPAGNSHVYDIEVDDDAHNFIAEGVVVHNCFAELIMLPGQGVVGLNPLPVATMRRIIDMRGSTLGYMQDMTGQFSFSMGNVKNIKELKQALRERQIIFFEPWEIVHWRLSSKHIRSIYGISVIDAARWIFKRLVMLEDTMLLYRLSRSPGRYAFYVDTGDLPPSEAMAQVKKVKQSYKKRTLLNPSTGQLEFRNNPMCLSGYTVVKLEDGRRLSILEIVEEFEAGKVNAVYSYDMESKKRKVMPITWAGKTRDHAAMVKVTLQNGNSIYCTPDHEFPLFDGGKCKAQDLNGKRLVSLNLDPEMVFDVCEWGPAEKTYTLTINGTHTFGLDAGVFTCNSPEEDIFIPTRGGKESTRVEILSGPDWSVNDDLEYLRDKLFTSIKIPRAYYGGDADASQSLAQKDVRFARTCLRIQREFRNGIRHIARVHMASLDIDPDSTEWDTRMTAPSSILELQQIETMNAQAGLISALENKLPLDWMLQRIMHLSQDDAATIMLKKDDEVANNAEAQARLAFELQKKYPGIDTSQLGDPGALPMGQGQEKEQQPGDQNNQGENINKKIDNINLLIKENIQSQRQVVKKIEEMGPVAKLFRRAYRRGSSKNASNQGKFD